MEEENQKSPYSKTSRITTLLFRPPPLRGKQAKELIHRHNSDTALSEQADQREVSGYVGVPTHHVLGASEKGSLQYQIIGGVTAHLELPGRSNDVRPGLNHHYVEVRFSLRKRSDALKAGSRKNPGEFI